MTTPTETPPAEPYARCRDCDVEFADEAATAAHRTSTFDLARAAKADPDALVRGHATQLVNPPPPTREETVAADVGDHISDAMDGAFECIDDDIDAGRYTTEEATAALAVYPDWADAWAEWLRDEDDEEGED